ncbi:LysR family transcriptional regulator [Phenylobacterium kunshanense]|uniref:HTH lysR-type domain-containing protein n=1 Tax=Phenylobacterium kunshanense TaxID=1445034 RepID=A0A328BDW0_9CAUL|nr:LysR substrate-binding domain-containing protein [Phenylobacterium kunshanense]RAK64835.1 hypothetical protein DJ019_12500 [Phenylobacterium kunshanense]
MGRKMSAANSAIQRNSAMTAFGFSDAHAMAMPSNLSWDGLRIFLACARHASFTRAAAELCMSVSAVSYQMAALEQRLGAALFRRTARGVVLTPEGERLAPTAEAMADTLASGLRSFRSTGTDLVVTAIGDVGVYWLMPRLAAFSRTHPEIRVTLETSSDLSAPSRGAFDLALRHGDGQWPGLDAHRLTGWRLQPMATPAVAVELSGRPWLETARLHGIDARWWGLWSETAGQPLKSGADLCLWETQLLVAQATLSGLGVGLLSPFAMHDELESGALVPLSGVSLKHTSAHWLAVPHGRGQEPAIEKLVSHCIACAHETGHVAAHHASDRSAGSDGPPPRRRFRPSA